MGGGGPIKRGAKPVCCSAMGLVRRSACWLVLIRLLGRIHTHGAVERLNRDYRDDGVALPPTIYTGLAQNMDWSRAMIVAPPSAHATPWTRRFGTLSTGLASGW